MLEYHDLNGPTDVAVFPEQICITRDNVQVHVDGVLYLKVLNPERASYGVADYLFAIIQLAQTTLRSEVGRIDLDRTFEERAHINTQVVNELDKASEPWGVKVLRYEIKNISPPADVLAAMEKQMRAEREKRAVVLTSEGGRDAAIDTAEGQKQQVIKAVHHPVRRAGQRHRHHHDRAGQRRRRGLDDRHRHEHHRPPRRRDAGRRRPAVRAAPRGLTPREAGASSLRRPVAVEPTGRSAAPRRSDSATPRRRPARSRR